MSFEMPLFDRYKIDVEFDRHRWYIKQGLREVPADEPVDAYVERTADGETICPLELGRLWLMPVQGGYEVHVPYVGDDELWHLYPGATHFIGILGEVFRGELILQVLTSTIKQAEEQAHERLSIIERIIEQQRERIRGFEESLPGFMRKELMKLRGGNGSKRPLISW
jgi:hypothetical protein